MKAAAFQELVTSIRQAGRIRRGTLRPSRVSAFRPADVISVATLRNWEQGRRTPEGPALALLRVAAKNPKAVADALHGKKGAA
jgi:putative transcriptional regulator